VSGAIPGPRSLTLIWTMAGGEHRKALRTRWSTRTAAGSSPRHPRRAVGDVQVIGVPDARYGEELCAWVRLCEGHQVGGEELRDWCRGKIASAGL
jgi:acyl-CoA synthetase (AMP-forming)/AMP-acid ligase II